MAIPAKAARKIIVDCYNRWYHMPNNYVIDVLAGTYLGMYWRDSKSRPVWLVNVGVSGSGKTSMIEPFLHLPNTLSIGKITAHSISSGYRSKKAKKAGESADILEQISQEVKPGKLEMNQPVMIVVKDASSLMSLRHDARAEVFSDLRQVHDGHLFSKFAHGKTVTWDGNVSFVMAATEEWDDLRQKEAQLGERFLNWRQRRDVSQAALDKVIETEIRGGDEKYNDFKNSMKVLLQVEIPPYGSLPITPKAFSALNLLAVASAELRTIIKRDYRGFPTDVARPEDPKRILGQLVRLMRGIMVFKGLPSEHPEVFAPVMFTALGCVPQTRIDLMSKIPNDGQIARTEIADAFSIPPKTAQRLMVELQMLNYVAFERTANSVLYAMNPERERVFEWVREFNMPYDEQLDIATAASSDILDNLGSWEHKWAFLDDLDEKDRQRVMDQWIGSVTKEAPEEDEESEYDRREYARTSQEQDEIQRDLEESSGHSDGQDPTQNPFAEPFEEDK